MAKPKAKQSGEAREQVKAQDLWVCLLCEEKPEFDGQRIFFAHIAERHPELVVEKEGGGRTIKATGEAIGHIDARDWFSWSRVWVLPDGRQLAAQETIQPRAVDDPMRY